MYILTGFLYLVFHADMAELADAPDLGSGGNPVQVQVLLSALLTGRISPAGLFLRIFVFFCDYEMFFVRIFRRSHPPAFTLR